MKTLLINSDGIVGANPNEHHRTRAEFEFLEDSPVWNAIKEREFQEHMERLWQGFVPFEDQEKIKDFLMEHNYDETFEEITDGKYQYSKIKPSSIIEADIEYEVVWEEIGQRVIKSFEGTPLTTETHYRQVLRLKD